VICALPLSVNENDKLYIQPSLLLIPSSSKIGLFRRRVRHLRLIRDLFILFFLQFYQVVKTGDQPWKYLANFSYRPKFASSPNQQRVPDKSGVFFSLVWCSQIGDIIHSKI
jgi:hypothetical protein